MAIGDPKERLIALRAWFQSAVADPEEAFARRNERMDLAGALFDEGSLDGEQYAAVFELGRALQQPDRAGAREQATRCLDLIR